MNRRHADVIGGGIGGLSAATALALAGWRVRLHERQPAIRAVGAGIYVWDNGLSALAAIDAYDEATAGAHIGPAVEARSRSGRTLYRIDINGPGGPRCYTLLRDRLIAALVRAAERAGVDLITESRAVAAAPDGTVTFDDGRTSTADLVVAADGVHSRLRDGLGLTHRRVRMRQGAARLMVPAGDYLPADDLPKHLEYFQGRRRLLYTPCTPEHVYLALVSDADDPATTGTRLDLASWRRSFPGLGDLLDSTGGIPIRWDTFEFIRLRSWSCGRVALLGDAAHAQPPYLGQGGGTAMTNAVSLAATLARPGLDLPAALTTWEREQRPGVERTQRTSYRMRLLNTVPDAVRDPLMGLLGRTSGFADTQLAATRLRPASS